MDVIWLDKLQEVFDRELGEGSYDKNLKYAGLTLTDCACFLLRNCNPRKRAELAHWFYYESDIQVSMLCHACGLENEGEFIKYVGNYEICDCLDCDQPIICTGRRDVDAANESMCRCKNCAPEYYENKGIWSGYVYILQSGDVFKIGKSVNVDRRVTQISPVMPYPVEVIHAIKTTDHTALERRLHGYFADKRLNGEWFRLTKQDVQLLKLMHDIEI